MVKGSPFNSSHPSGSELGTLATETEQDDRLHQMHCCTLPTHPKPFCTPPTSLFLILIWLLSMVGKAQLQQVQGSENSRYRGTELKKRLRPQKLSLQCQWSQPPPSPWDLMSHCLLQVLPGSLANTQRDGDEWRGQSGQPFQMDFPLTPGVCKLCF